MHDAFRSVDRLFDNERIADRSEDVGGSLDQRGSPLQRAHVVSRGDEFGRDGTAEETRGPGDEHDHGAVSFPPAGRGTRPRGESRPVEIFEL